MGSEGRLVKPDPLPTKLEAVTVREADRLPTDRSLLVPSTPAGSVPVRFAAFRFVMP